MCEAEATAFILSDLDGDSLRCSPDLDVHGNRILEAPVACACAF
jgi:hypothetical protein